MRVLVASLWLSALFLMNLAVSLPPAQAMVIMDDAAIEHAIRYGAKKAGRGYEELLGPNWRIGQDGTLLNIYTPYMTLAGKVYRAGFPTDLTPADLKEAKRKFASELRYLRDANDPKLVKFAVNLLGERASFPQGWHALVRGVGNGRAYEFKPGKSFRPQQATQTAPGGKQPYEAVLSFYFKQVDLLKLQGPYELTLTDTESDRTVSFRLDNDRLY